MDHLDALRGVRILVVEDDADTLDLFATVLRRQGAEVSTAINGQQAVDAYTERFPDVVIADIRLPNVDGHALVRYLRRVGMDVPSIAVTALATADDRYRSAQVGFDLHLTKPVDPDTLLRAVLAVLPTRR